MNDEESWYECLDCGALLYGQHDRCWCCGVSLSFDDVISVEFGF